MDVTNCPIGGDKGSNLYDVEPNLGPLEDNGGATLTHALAPDSLAIDAGNPKGCTNESAAWLIRDQIGSPRHIDGNEDGIVACDIGAYELNQHNQQLSKMYLPIITDIPTPTPTPRPSPTYVPYPSPTH
jgi:hypothetical protein